MRQLSLINYYWKIVAIPIMNLHVELSSNIINMCGKLENLLYVIPAQSKCFTSIKNNYVSKQYIVIISYSLFKVITKRYSNIWFSTRFITIYNKDIFGSYRLYTWEVFSCFKPCGIKWNLFHFVSEKVSVLAHFANEKRANACFLSHSLTTVSTENGEMENVRLDRSWNANFADVLDVNQHRDYRWTGFAVKREDTGAPSPPEANCGYKGRA